MGDCFKFYPGMAFHTRFYFFGGEFVDFLFVVNSLLLGAGLSMDAFSVSLANGLGEPEMPRGKMLAVS